jgi:hypothetical protein
MLYCNCVFSVVKAKKPIILTSTAVETCIKYFTFYKYRFLVSGLGLVPPLAKLHWNCEKEKVIFYVMPLEKFVSCVGDLATIGGSVWSWPQSVYPLVPSPFVCEALGIRKFYSGTSLTLWPSWVSEGLWCEQDARVGRSLSGHILGGSISALPGFQFIVYRLQYSHGLWVAVCFNLEPRTGYPYIPLEEINIRVLVIH